jgi:hypothetical protein
VGDFMETRFYNNNNVEFAIGGKIYSSLSNFTKSIKLKKSGKRSSIYVRKDGFFNVTGYVVERSELLTCFDSSDYIYEDRNRSEYFFVDDYESAKELFKAFDNMNHADENKYERLIFIRNDSLDKTFITVTK